MAKIKLGSRPKSFTSTVRFPMIEGGEGAIEVKFKYRTRVEFGKFVDGLMDAAGAKPADAEEKFSMADLMERTAGSNAAYILDVVDGWNLEEELTLANVQQLADEIPAAAIAIMDSYRAAVTEGRLGN